MRLEFSQQFLYFADSSFDVYAAFDAGYRQFLFPNKFKIVKLNLAPVGQVVIQGLQKDVVGLANEFLHAGLLLLVFQIMPFVIVVAAP